MVDRRTARREAKFRAGLILESVLAQGYFSEPEMIERYGAAGAAKVEAEMTALAERLIETSGPPYETKEARNEA